MLSGEIAVNTGAPQGCVLSPILFSIYMNDISSNNSSVILIKYADDMAIVGYLNPATGHGRLIGSHYPCA